VHTRAETLIDVSHTIDIPYRIRKYAGMKHSMNLVKSMKEIFGESVSGRVMSIQIIIAFWSLPLTVIQDIYA
jgi:hypothetical protein